MWTRDNLVPYVSDFVSPTVCERELGASESEGGARARDGKRDFEGEKSNVST